MVANQACFSRKPAFNQSRSNVWSMGTCVNSHSWLMRSKQALMSPSRIHSGPCRFAWIVQLTKTITNVPFGYAEVAAQTIGTGVRILHLSPGCSQCISADSPGLVGIVLAGKGSQRAERILPARQSSPPCCSTCGRNAPARSRTPECWRPGR